MEFLSHLLTLDLSHLFAAFMVIGAVIALNASQLQSDGGLTPASQGALTVVDTYTFPNDGRTYLYITKGANAGNVTIITPGTVRGLAIADKVVAMTPNDKTLVGPFAPDLYNDATGLVSVTFSEITGLTVAVVRF
jgi:hypothetical protein